MPPKFKSRFSGGAAAIAKAAASSGPRTFTPKMTWDANETKFIQFLHPLEDAITVLAHEFIIVGTRDNGKPKYEEFISRRSDLFDGPDGYDELADRFGQLPRSRTITIAAELRPIRKQGSKAIDGWDIETREFTTKDGEEKSVPNIALVVQSPSNFYGYLTTFVDSGMDINEKIFQVTKRGQKKDTRYDFIPVDDAIDLDDIAEEFLGTFDVDAYIENLADEQRMRDIIGPLPDDFQVSLFPSKDKDKDNKKSENVRSRRAAPKVEEEPDNGSEPEAEAGEEPQGSTRRRRFQDLRQQVGE